MSRVPACFRWGIAVALAMAALFHGVNSARAQIAVTSYGLGPVVNNADQYANELTFLNIYAPVTSVSTATTDYVFNGPSATNVAFRRNLNSGNANDSSFYYRYGYYSDTVIGRGDATPTLAEVMLSNDVSQGLHNPFANGTDWSEGNIERIDITFAGGYTVQTGDAIVLFDLENLGDRGDGFRIAAFNSVNSSLAPVSYVNTGLLVNPDSYGVAAPNGELNSRYAVSTTSSGDNLNASEREISILDSNNGTPNSSDGYLSGVVILLSDLGLSVGQTIYGYSLMAGDVRVSSANDLVNWNNTSVYRTDTDATTWGNVDFAGFGTTMGRAVPEPEFYGAGLLLLGVLAHGFARARNRRRA